MTHIERFCMMRGTTPPNMNTETGIHYGVIPQSDLMPETLDDIYSNGTDLTYLSAVADVKARIESAIRSITTVTDESITAADIETELRSWLKDYISRNIIDSDLADTVLQALEAKTDTSEIIEGVWEAIEQDYNDHYETDFSNSLYRYESDGITIEASETDLFITQSPYYSLCSECSPCAPNAGYLTSPGSLKAYCLPSDWFDEYSPLPYDVYLVETNQLVAAKTEASE
jgi:hypothetical protein